MFKNTLGVIDKIKKDINIATVVLEVLINLVIIGFNVYALYNSIVNDNIFGIVISTAVLIALLICYVMHFVTRKNKSKKAKAVERKAKRYYRFLKRVKKNAYKIIKTMAIFAPFTANISIILIMPLLIIIAVPFIIQIIIKYINAQLDALKNAFIEDVKQPFEATGEAVDKAWKKIFKKKEGHLQRPNGSTTFFDESDLEVYGDDSAKNYNEHEEEQLIIL